ncbi:MAG: metallophosphoesterase [Bryobacterales bacterium]|nr:metallophosphoesterase [Bryobacterales bacterium]
MRTQQKFSRRDLLAFGSAAATVLALPGAAAQSAPDAFTFVHFTDTHIQPELKADEGCRRCFAKINALKPAFALSGGDLVFDVMETGKEKAKQLFDLYDETRKRLEMPVYHAIGNHDVLGLSPKSTLSEADPQYGKKLFEDRIGKRYSSFDHGRWHFVLLDSIGIAPGRNYIGMIDEEQLDWLRNDLASTGPARPIVITTHIPLVSAVLQEVADRWAKRENYLINNSQEVLKTLEGYNVKAVLQGHTHIREEVVYKGVRYLTSGAVSGNWWKGEREGHPEGFGVLSVNGDQIDWRYETYGWQAAA